MVNRLEKLVIKHWRAEYEKIIHDHACGLLTGLKCEVVLDNGLVWWAFRDKRHEIVVDQCMNTGDWLKYVEQGNGPHLSRWRRVLVPNFRICVDSYRIADTHRLMDEWRTVRNVSYTSDLAWPGITEKQFRREME